MNKSAKILFLLLSIILISPQDALAEISCPPRMDYYIGVTPPLLGDKYYNTSDIPNFSFNVNKAVTYPNSGNESKVPGDGDNVQFGIGIRPPATFFTTIYANIANSIRLFIPIEDYRMEANPNLTPEDVESWNRFYCLSGLDDVSNTGSLGTHIDGTYTYRVQVKSKDTDTTSPECIAPIDAPPDWSPPDSCTKTNTRIDDRPGEILEDPVENFNIPYPRSLNELARKMSSVIKEQYCVVGQTTCNGSNYNCIKYEKLNFTAEQFKNDPAAVGKDGFCVPKKEQPDGSLIDTITEVPDKVANLMCSTKIDSSSIPGIVPIPSNVCYFDPPTMKVTQTISNCPSGNCKYPLLNVANVGNMSNSIPFDTEIFSDNGETTNANCYEGGDVTQCKRDGYFKRAITNNLSKLSPDEQKWMDNLNGYLDIRGPIENATLVDEYNPGYYKDVIQDLGKYTEISNDARVLSNEIQPTGYRVVQDKGNTAYLRAINNVGRGILFINEHPVGKLPLQDGSPALDSPQGPPFIFTQFKGLMYVTATVSNAQLYISVSLHGGEKAGGLIPVPGYGQTYDLGKFFAFVTSEDRVIVIASSGPKGKKNPYKYTIYDGVNFTEPREFTDQSGSVTQEFAANATMALDAADNLHIIGNDSGELGDLGANFVKYAKYKIKTDPSNIGQGPQVVPVISPKPIMLPSKLSLYWSSGYTVQSDLQGGAIAAVSVNDSSDDFWSDNIWFFHIDANGNEIQSESSFAVRRDQVNPKGFAENGAGPRIKAHHRFTANGPQISAHQIIGGGIDYYLVYHTHTDLSVAIHKVNQINYAVRTFDVKTNSYNNWVQDTPLSDRVSDDAGGVEAPTIDLNLNTVFTLTDLLTKYHKNSRLFDAAGYKRCEFNTILAAAATTECGKVRDDTYYVIPPSQNSTNMQFVKLQKFY